MSELTVRFQSELKIRNYSPNTISAYLYYIEKFTEFGHNHSYSPRDRIFYFLKNYEEKQAAVKIAYSSIKTFYKIVIHKDCPYVLDKNRRIKDLPSVLNKEDIITIINTISNVRHRTMIAMLYGSGLRISEVVNLKIRDVDFVTATVKIRRGKGYKDRYTLLSPTLIDPLKYLIEDRPPGEFLFKTLLGKKYSTRTIQVIFQKACQSSGLKIKATCHTLRHSFATHLMENGTNVKKIMELMGHSSVSTTMVYLHLAESRISQIKSPL
jgi:integrase/recombinase XerD